MDLTMGNTKRHCNNGDNVGGGDNSHWLTAQLYTMDTMENTV